MSKNLLVSLLILLVIFLTVFSMYRITQPRVLSEEEMKVNGFVKYGDNQEVRIFDLVDHNGEQFTNLQLEDNKINLLYFGYTTCPTECPVMMSVMRQVYSKIETNEIAYYLISFDPEIDTKDQLKKYVTAFNENFIGITGDLSEVLKLGYQLGVEKLAPTTDHMNHRVISHTNHLIAINSDGKILGIFRGPFDSSSMSLVIKSLLITN